MSSWNRTLRFAFPAGEKWQTNHPPAPLVLIWAQVLVQGQKCGKTGSPSLDRPVLPHGTYHRTHVADISHAYPFTTMKGCPLGQHTPQSTRAHGITGTPTL